MAKKKNKKFINKNLIRKNFWETDLSHSEFHNTKVHKSVFTDANLRNSIFRKSEIVNTNLTHADLRGVDFRTSKLINVNLRDAVFNNKTLWPKNFNPIKYGAIESKNFNPFSYKRKLSYKTVKSLSLKEIDFYKNKIKKKERLSKNSEYDKKIIYELTKGKGYIIIKNFYKKNLINKAEKIIDKKLKKNKNYKKATINYEEDKINK